MRSLVKGVHVDPSMEHCMTGPIWFLKYAILKYAMLESDGSVADPIKTRVASTDGDGG